MTSRWLPIATFLLPLLMGVVWIGGLGLTHNAQFVPVVLFASIVGIIFCLALASGNKAALTVLLCCAIILISITFRQRATGEVGLDFQNGYKFAILILLLMVYVLYIRYTIRYYRDPVILLFFVFCLCNLISSLYSPVPLVSFANAVGTMAYFGFALVVIEVLGIRATLVAALVTISIYSFLNLLSPLYAPDASYMLTDPSTGIYRFQGISGQPNSLSRQCSIFLILILVAYQRGYLSRPLAIGMGVLAFSLAIVTEGRTAMLALLFAVVLQLRGRYLIPILIVCATSVVTMWFTGVINIIFEWIGRRGDANEALSLAGRTELWSFVWQQIIQQPIIGHGYNSFETIAAEHYWVGADKGIVIITHNAYLDILFDTGIIGGILFFSPFIILLARWIWRPNLGRDLVVWTMLLGGITEVELTVAAILPPIMFFIMLALDAKENLYD